MATPTPNSESQPIVKKAYRAFFSPGKYEVKPSDRAILERGNNSRLPFDGSELAITTWGDRGPSALLMHGWGGSRAQMTGFVDPLLNAGYRVVAYDQPAHGESGGEMTNLFEIAPTMNLLAEREGNFHAIIAHSNGTLITSYALARRNLAPPARLAYFGSFNRLMDYLPRFQALAGLPDAAIEGLRLMIYKNFGQEAVESIVNEFLAPQINVPALMFHDTADNITPIEDSRAIARVWKSARLIETEGMGHRGALQSKDIHAQVVKFLKNE
jgi:pimeloyl-ACP methyl ester carboxylesterase